MNAAFRYHGSKWRFYPFIAEYINKSPVYTESFRAAPPSYYKKPITGIEVYNDLDADVYNFFYCRVHHNFTPAGNRIHALRSPTLRGNQRSQTAQSNSFDPIERPHFSLCEQGWGGKKHNGRRSGASKDSDNNAQPRLVMGNAPIVFSKSATACNVFIENRPATQVIKDYDSPETIFV